MRRINTGYTRGMFEVIKRLQKLGLPETLFDADFKEKEEENRNAHADLLERMRAMEQDEKWKDVDLPWKAAREEFEQQVGEEGFIASQPSVPSWKRDFELNFLDWQRNRKDKEASAKRRQERKKNKSRCNKRLFLTVELTG